MTAVWMGWAILLAGLLGGAAALAEWLLRGRGLPGRGPWMAAMLGSLALPAWAAWGPEPAPAAADAVGGQAAQGALSPALLAELGAVLDGRVAPPLAFLDPWLEAGWLAASLLLLAWLGLGLGRLALRARRWPRRTVSGHEVLVSRAFGPALLGLRSPRIVLPGWSLALDDTSLELVVRHEREHARAGDGLVLLASALAVAVAPWNPALWWHFRRLRGALEMDCDARVLRAGASPAGYGRLLLALGARSGDGPLTVAGLARHDSLLERRLTMMGHGVDRGTRTRRTAAVVGALALVVVACEAPAPTAAPDPPAAESALAESAPGTFRLEPAAEDATRPSPLFVVDGEVVTGPLELARERVAQVDVLKGGAATEAWGEAGADGVVVITTKDGLGPAPVAEGETPLGGVVTHAPAEESTLPENAEVFVDGERFQGELSDIDPETIARVDVRKGPEGPDQIHIFLKP